MRLDICVFRVNCILVMLLIGCVLRVNVMQNANLIHVNSHMP